MYLGIDPGTSGAAVALNDKLDIVAYLDFAKCGARWAEELKRLVEMYSWKCVVLEEVASMPGQGLSSTFEFGRRFGMAMGVLAGCGVKYELLRPRVWQKLAWYPGPKSEWLTRYKGKPKEISYLSACYHWGEDLFVGPKGGKDDGIVDAAHLARAGSIKTDIRDYTASDEYVADQIAARKAAKKAAKAKKARQERAANGARTGKPGRRKAGH